MSLADSLGGPAKEAFRSARLLFNNGDFAGALTKYDQAYSLSKDPRLLFNMAVCARSLRAYARMQSLLLQYQREASPETAAESQGEIGSALAAIANLVGSVKLVVDESGATAVVDGNAVGTTPLSEPLLLDLGDHVLTLQKPGFRPFERRLHIAGGNEVSVTVTLTAEAPAAHLVVVTDDVAMVSVDGLAGVLGRFDGTLAVGAHDVQVTERDKAPYESRIELRSGEMRRLDVTLEPAAGSSASPWPWIAGGVAVAAGAALGGYFLFKSSDVTVSSTKPTIATVNFASFGGR